VPAVNLVRLFAICYPSLSSMSDLPANG